MIKLRRFLLSDLDRVIEIEGPSFPDPWPKSYLEKLYQKHPKEFVVAEKERKIVGYGIGKLKNDVAEMISLAVDPKWRKKGVGRKLMNFLVNHFRQKGAKEILLHVRTKNKSAISFYKKLGFEIAKTIKKHYRNGDNAYLMRKIL